MDGMAGWFLFVCLFYLFVGSFVRSFLCLFLCLLICLFVDLFVCLFVCLFVSTGMDPHICATCTSYEYMSPADACPVWLKAVTFTVLERLVKSKGSASDLAPYRISA